MGQTSTVATASTRGQLGLMFFGLRRVFRPVVRAGLRVAEGLGQHLAQLGLRLRWFPRDRCLPVSHKHYVGIPEGELNPTGGRKNRGTTISPMGPADARGKSAELAVPRCLLGRNAARRRLRGANFAFRHVGPRGEGSIPVTRIFPSYVGAHFNLGLCLLHPEDREGASRQLTVLSFLDPSLAQRYAALLSRRGRTGQERRVRAPRARREDPLSPDIVPYPGEEVGVHGAGRPVV